MFEFFKSEKGSKDRKKSVKVAFDHVDQWQEIMKRSKQGPVFIFKHSSRCGISSVVLNRFEKQISQRQDHFFMVHIQAHRDLSNWLAEQLQIRHESPQLLVIKNEKVMAHDSHYALLDIVPNMD